MQLDTIFFLLNFNETTFNVKSNVLVFIINFKKEVLMNEDNNYCEYILKNLKAFSTSNFYLS